MDERAPGGPWGTAAAAAHPAPVPARSAAPPPPRPRGRPWVAGRGPTGGRTKTNTPPHNDSSGHGRREDASSALSYHERTSSSTTTSTSAASERGELRFWDGFEGGNLGTVRRLEGQQEYEVALNADTMNPRYRLWFYFRVSNAEAGQKVVFTVVNMSKQRSLFREGMTPVVRSSSRPHWERIHPKNCFYYKSPKHKMAYVLSFLFTFDREDDEYFFAYSFPYTYSDLQQYLAAQEYLKAAFLRREVLCRSVNHRKVDVLTIGDPERMRLATPLAVRPVVFVTSRVHPDGTPASYVTHGLIDHLLSDEARARELRRDVTVVVVPMLNPDGVYAGNYRTDSTGVDLNRMWGSPYRELEPSLHHVKELIGKYSRDPRYRIDLFIDMHSHSTCKDSFMFCNPAEPGGGSIREMEEQVDRILCLPKILASRVKEFSLQACRWDKDPAKAGCARRVINQLVPGAICYTMEVSFFHTSGSFHSGLVDRHRNTIESYMRMGAEMGAGLHEFFRGRTHITEKDRLGVETTHKKAVKKKAATGAALGRLADGAKKPGKKKATGGKQGLSTALSRIHIDDAEPLLARTAKFQGPGPRVSTAMLANIKSPSSPATSGWISRLKGKTTKKMAASGVGSKYGRVS